MTDEIIKLGKVPAGFVCIQEMPPKFTKDNVTIELDLTSMKMVTTIDNNTIKETNNDTK